MKSSLGSSTRLGRVAIPVGIALAAGLPLLLAGGSSSVGALTPDLPQFPNNLVVFPNRDFVTIEGFSEYVGQSGTVEVTRPGVGVVGSAIGEVSGGDVAFEINHPGGYCWGAGTDLKVTPDIKAGDVVSFTVGGDRFATTTLDVAADDAIQHGTKTVVVTGRIGDGVITDNMEQRIIEPALVDTSIGGAMSAPLPGPMVPAAEGWLLLRTPVQRACGHVQGDVCVQRLRPRRPSRPMQVSVSGRWPGSSSTGRATVRV